MLSLPLYDLPTRSASGFLIRYVLPRSAPPQLVGPLDRKGAFQTLVIGDAIIGAGHGSPTQFCGHNDQVILDVDTIPEIRDKVVVLISCETAQRLGPALVDAGASGYIGFNKDLVWVCDADRASTPWSDKLAATVMRPISDCINSILDGRTVGESFEVLTAELWSNAEAEEDEIVRSCITFNRKNAARLGDPEARIRARPRVSLPIPPPPIILPLKGG